LPDDTAEIQDFALLKRAVKDKDRKALEAFHAKYYPLVRHFAASQIGPGPAAEDIAQEVLLRLLEPNACFDVQRTIEAYLYGVVRRVTVQYFQKEEKQRQTVPLDLVGEIVDKPHSQRNGGRPGPVPSQHLKKIIKDATAELPPKAREATFLRLLEGLSMKEGAQRAGCSEDTFRTRVARAVRMLRRICRRKLQSEIDDRLIP
jgi:RNA polymerase sigma-70 factor (ECF subfamily)